MNMNYEELNKKQKLLFLSGFTLFWILIMLIMASIGREVQSYEKKIIHYSNWWEKLFPPQYPEIIKQRLLREQGMEKIEILLPEDAYIPHESLLDINDLRPYSAFYPPMYKEMAYQQNGEERIWDNYIPIRPMKPIIFGRERDPSGVQNDVRIIALPGYFFK